MDATLVVVLGLLALGVIVWLSLRLRKSERRLRESEAKLDVARSYLKKRLADNEREIRDTLGKSAQRGTTVSTESVLKGAEELRAAYLSSGNQEAALEVERVIRQFREKHDAEIPVDQAYELMREIEKKYE